MGNTRSVTINQNSDDGGGTPWSDVSHDVLNLVMIRLEVIDFLAFSGVCKSWRSFALSKRNSFMASKQPMYMSISTNPNDKECYLKDFEGRKFKTILPHSAGRTCIGLTCGYLIFYGDRTCDFWLVNPVTRHELHFPKVPFYVIIDPKLRLQPKAILVFSPSISEWVFVMFHRPTKHIWFSMGGKGAWNHVSSNFPILDLHVFKGKIYTLQTQHDYPHQYISDLGHVWEMSIGPNPKLTLLETKNFLMAKNSRELVSWGGHLYVIQYMHSGDFFKANQLDFGEMKWVCHENTREEYAFFISRSDRIVVVKPESWVGPQLQYKRFLGTHTRFNDANMWYFPHDCLNVNFINK